jgi:hypothetical protein
LDWSISSHRVQSERISSAPLETEGAHFDLNVRLACDAPVWYTNRQRQTGKWLELWLTFGGNIMRTVSCLRLAFILVGAALCLSAYKPFSVGAARGTLGPAAGSAADIEAASELSVSSLVRSGVLEESFIQGEEMASAKLVLTKFAITGEKLELAYLISNESDHEIWYCEDPFITNDAFPGFEIYFDGESDTLVVRKRLDVPDMTGGDYIVPPAGRYVRLKPGERRNESYSHVVPVYANTIYQPSKQVQGLEHAKRLIIEIGFYDESLPAKISAILAEAERFTGTFSDEWDDDLVSDYFAGLYLGRIYGGPADYNEAWASQISAGAIPVWHMFGKLKGERVLRITVDGVNIPYTELPQNL